MVVKEEYIMNNDFFWLLYLNNFIVINLFFVNYLNVVINRYGMMDE